LRIGFFFSVRSIGLLFIILFSGSNYLELRFTDRVRVEGILTNYEGPWDRIRGGEKELFIKLHYTYNVRGEGYQKKEEITLRNRDEVDNYLRERQSVLFFVDNSDPKRIVNPSDDGWEWYFAILFVSILLFVLRIFSHSQTKNQIIEY
jgi:hypothetical protein